MARLQLDNAKKNKEDEFYTQLADIESELRHYKDHFLGKVILCNCDDPYESNFFKYFAMNFNYLGLKKLIATNYAKSPVAFTQLPLFSGKSIADQREGRKRAYKIEISEVRDDNADGAVDLADVERLLLNGNNALSPLNGDGDFRSPECIRLLKQADVIVTNPPFSLFREYVSQLIEHNKKFVIIGGQNAITYKEIFPLVPKNKLWIGNNSGDMEFTVPVYYQPRISRYREENGTKYRSMGNVCWYTNLDIQKRHEKLTLFKQYKPEEYPLYDNYDAINVDKVSEIPYDYDGAMGVPITFLDKYNPDQFEILGITKTWFGGANKIYANQIQVNTDGEKTVVSKLNDGATLKLDKPPQGKTYYIVDNEYYIQLYARIIIRKKGSQK